MVEDALAALAALEARLRGGDGLVVALSGGVDSSVVLAAARRTSRAPVLAATVRSAMQPAGELDRAAEVARRLGVPHRFVELDPLAAPEVRRNGPDRCYHCKRLVMARLLEVAREEGLGAVADGSNADDARAYRPGARALRELGVRSPLAEAGLTKRAVRAVARHLGLVTAEQPPLACLASRVPYGVPLTPDRLGRIDRAEAVVRGLVEGQVRVRDHGGVARIEVEPERVPDLLVPAVRAVLTRALRELGYLYVTADLEGYRTGAMDEVLLRREEETG